jgi:hypothetical protein
MRQVPRHRRGRSAEVRERRRRHAPVSNRHQIRHPRLGLLLEKCDRIRSIRRWFPLGVARTRYVLSLLFASMPPLDGREQFVWRGEYPRRHPGHAVTPPGTATHWPAVLSREWSASQTDQGLIVNAVSRKHSGEVGIVDSRAMRPEIVHCASRYSRHSSKVDITAVAGQLTTPSSPGGPKPVEVGSITQQQIVKIERTRRRALRIPDALLYFGYGGAGVGRCSRPSVLAEADLESAQPGCYCIGLRDTSATPVLPTPLNRD